ncbi:hypothetical protein [Emticicia sp. C21]|uniref:hypothetical protein n=1 Tax=Emticicia sp. C21 TaxID=2302915 RepID=UPI000E9E41F6|nr:hypothetical protein [Emticicia sp. C21]RFS15067.1 hypothetical protein D0T08_18490 [Emticicia sp. C21]
MKKTIVLLLAFMVYSGIHAQSLNILLSSQMPKIEIIDGKKVTTVEVSSPTGDSGSGGRTPRSISYLGSPFFIDTFQTTTFSVDSSTAPITAPVILNLANDELLVQLADKITPLRKINFSLAGHEFVNIKDRYYEQLYGGQVQLLKRYERSLIPVLINNSIAGSGYGRSSQKYDGEIGNKEIYYLVFHGNKMRVVNMNPKSIINVLKKENKGHFVNGDFERMNENDEYLKAMEKVSNLSKIDEKALVKALRNADSPVLP